MDFRSRTLASAAEVPRGPCGVTRVTRMAVARLHVANHIHEPPRSMAGFEPEVTAPRNARRSGETEIFPGPPRRVLLSPQPAHDPGHQPHRGGLHPGTRLPPRQHPQRHRNEIGALHCFPELRGSACVSVVKRHCRSVLMNQQMARQIKNRRSRIKVE